MKLHEINEVNNIIGQSILIEEIYKYKKSLLVYWSDMYSCDQDELILVVTNVYNSCSYGFISDSDQYNEVVQDYVSSMDLSEEEEEDEIELINFNSIQLKNL